MQQILSLLNYLKRDFKRSERNLNNPEKKEIAQKIVTVKSHLKQRLDDIKGIKDSKSKKTLDLTIKMWDRIPQKDLFQGNYSTCCTAMGDVNANTMPHQIMDSAYNMIELVDNKTEDVIGNALCYFAKNESNEPCFIIDNIEIKNSRKPSDEVGRDIRNKMAEFAKKVSKDVTGKDDIKIYMSDKYNDVPCDDLESHTEKNYFLGDTDCD